MSKKKKPACRISEAVSSLVLNLGLHFVVGSSRLDNTAAFVKGLQHPAHALILQVGTDRNLLQRPSKVADLPRTRKNGAVTDHSKLKKTTSFFVLNLQC